MSLLDLVKSYARPAFAKASARQAVQTKSSAAGPMIAWTGVGQPRWTPRRYDQLAEEGFKKNTVAYRCVMHIAKACSGVPWLLYDKDGNEIAQHPLLTLLKHPNPMQDGVTFLENIYANLEIAGNAYVEAVTPQDSNEPTELYSLRPDRMKVIPGRTGLPQGYQYTVNAQTTTWHADPITGASPILHIKRFHPLDDWYGLAPMEAALLAIDQHNSAGAWNQALLNHGARPSGALVYAPKDGPSTLTDEQIQRLREQLSEVNQGQRNAGRPMILEGGLEWREMSLSPKDMDWLAGRDASARDIALAFGVPTQLIGIPGAQTYANMAEARLAFYEETVLPNLTHVISAFDHWLVPQFGGDLDLDYDPDCISALSARRESQWQALNNATFLTRTEKREAAGYAPDTDGGDDDIGSDSDDPDPAGKLYAYCGTGKFNPNHDPSNGQFTFGAGTTEDSADNTDGSNTPSHSTIGKIGNFLQWATHLSSAHAAGLEEDEIRNAGEGDSATAEIRSAAYESAISTLRELDPNNPQLESISSPNWVPSWDDINIIRQEIATASNQRVMNFAMPNGEPAGEKGNAPWIRILSGDLSAAQRDFQNLTLGGTVLNLPTYRGTMMRLPGNTGLIGLRPESSDLLPTLDFKILDIPFKTIHYK